MPSHARCVGQALPHKVRTVTRAAAKSTRPQLRHGSTPLRTLQPRANGPAQQPINPHSAAQRAVTAIRASFDAADAWEALASATRQAGHALVVGAAAASLFIAPLAAEADEREILRFPASPDPAIYSAQQTLVEAWSVVHNSFVDGSFGGTDWERELGRALDAAYHAPDGGAAYEQISKLLERLGDPFTRIVPPSAYADFRVSSDGEVQGVGLLIAADPASGKLVVLAPVRGGPADRAGMRKGDVVESIDGNATDGWDGERAAQVLRGRSGSAVTVRIARRTDQMPGVPGRPEAPPRMQTKQVRLRREKVEVSPVVAAPVHAHGHTWGYIRLVNFGQHAGDDTRAAIQQLEKQGVQGFILDLRNNPGGLVRSGLDVAHLFLEGQTPVFNVTGRTDATSTEEGLLQSVVLDPGSPATTLPLAVLINEASASASEILAGALHDNARAELIGHPSFGKGRIQSVFELVDGSALFVTVAKYKTPAMHEIDSVGIAPDMSCNPRRSAPPRAGKPIATQASAGPVFGPDDIAAAPPGPPFAGALSDADLERALEADSCVLTAQHVLERAAGPAPPVIATIPVPRGGR